MRKVIFAVFTCLFLFSGLNIAGGEEALAPDFKLSDINGKNYSFSDYKGKQPVILFFWTTWCPFCQDEIKKISQKAVQLEKEGIKVLTIDLGESKDKVAYFAQKRGLSVTILLDSTSMVGDYYEVGGVPTFFLINKEGRIVFQDNQFPEHYKELINRK